MPGEVHSLWQTCGKVVRAAAALQLELCICLGRSAAFKQMQSPTKQHLTDACALLVAGQTFEQRVSPVFLRRCIALLFVAWPLHFFCSRNSQLEFLVARKCVALVYVEEVLHLPLFAAKRDARTAQE